jgi:hypothetical protein
LAIAAEQLHRTGHSDRTAPAVTAQKNCPVTCAKD